MQAKLKSTGEWIDIDTKYLFNNQYNTTGNARIFDRDISAIRDDARKNMGRCRYCGAMVKRGEEEAHYTEREKNPCSKCFWFRARVIDSKTETETTTETGPDGERITTMTRTTREKLQKECTYSNASSARADCTNKECRKYGIDWFTTENTFFLKYPNGLDDITEIDKLETRGFIIGPYKWSDAQYFKKLGSYTLEALLKRGDDGTPEAVTAYRISNARRDYKFRIEKGLFFVDRWNDGWRQEKTLEGIPEKIMDSVKAICAR